MARSNAIKLPLVDAQIPLSDAISLLEVCDDNRTIMTEHGYALQVIRMKGLLEMSLDKDVLEDIVKSRGNIFSQLQEGIQYSFFYQRKKAHTDAKKISHTGSDIADRMIKKHYASLSDLYDTEISLVVSKKMPSISRFSDKKYREKEEEHIEEFSKDVAAIAEKFENYHPSILEHKNDGTGELLPFWHYLVNGGNEGVSHIQSHSLGRLLAASEVWLPWNTFRLKLTRQSMVTKKEASTMTFCHAGETTSCLSVLAVSGYPDETFAGILDRLMDIPHTFTILQNVFHVDPDKVKGKIRDKIHNNVGTSFFSAKKIEKLASAGEDIVADEVVYASHNYLIFVYGSDQEDLEEGVRIISSRLADNGYQTIRERTNLYASYLAQFPDYSRQHKVRSEYATSDNISDMTLLSGRSKGLKKCHWGNEPVAVFKTQSKGKYDFVFHSNETDDHGHTMIIGPTGGGKTVLIEWFVANCMKYGTGVGEEPLRALMFDSNQGLRVFTEAMGGDYTITKENDTLSMNPFQLPDSDENRNFLIHLMKMLAGTLSDSEINSISQMIRTNYKMDQEDRTLENLIEDLPPDDYLDKDRDTISLRERLEKWYDRSNATYGHYFTSERDNLFKGEVPRIVTYDMAGLLDNEDLLPPIASYIFHSFRKICDLGVNRKSVPHICFIDEMPKYLKNPHFASFINDVIREWRKLNGVLIGALQSAKDLTGNPLGQLILENVATLLIFPNGNADKKHYCGDGENPGLGLTESEFNWIKQSAGLKRHVLVKKTRSGESAVLNLDLSSLGEDLKFLSSSKDSVNQMLYMKQQYGDQWRSHYVGG